MKKSDRQRIYDKFGGKCAYSGKDLNGELWEVDHLTPKSHVKFMLYDNNFKRVYDPNHIDNLVPSIKIINHYKRGLSFVMWRERMNKLHERLAKLPKNTRRDKTKKTKEYLLLVASYFGITKDQPFDGLFYFEKMNIDQNVQASVATDDDSSTKAG